MAQRSRADKVEDGRKGAVRKIAQYGPDELNRAGRQAAWTKQHPGGTNPKIPTCARRSASRQILTAQKTSRPGPRHIPTSLILKTRTHGTSVPCD
jgi:hypothetical protein